MKHGKYVLDRVEWSECARCGEPKLPHRICRKNLDICAMREEDWKVEKLRREVEKARVEP
jgi:ribosomal protein L32